MNRECVIVADSTLEAPRLSETLTIQAPTDVFNTGELGCCWPLEADAVLELRFPLQDGFANTQVELSLIGIGPAESELSLTINSGQPQRIFIVSHSGRQTVITRTSELIAGGNVVTLRGVRGRGGVQVAKVAYEMPYPQIELVTPQSKTTLTLLEPTAVGGATVGQRNGIVPIRWETKNDRSENSSFVKLGYKASGGKIVPLGGPLIHHSSASFPWPGESGIDAPATLTLTAEIFQPPQGESTELLDVGSTTDRLVSPDCMFAFTDRYGTEGRPVDCWDLANRVHHGTFSLGNEPSRPEQTLVSPDGRYIFIEFITLPGGIQEFGLWEIRSGALLRKYSLNPAYRSFSMLPDNRRVLVHLNNELGLFDLETDETEIFYSAPQGRSIERCWLSPDGTFITYLERLNNFTHHMVAVGVPTGIEYWRKMDFEVRDTQFSPDGKTLLALQNIQIPSSPTNAPIRQLRPKLHRSTNGAVKAEYPGTYSYFQAAFTPDGEHIVSCEATSDEPQQFSVCCRKAADGQLVETLTPPPGTVVVSNPVTISPSGNEALVWIGKGEDATSSEAIYLWRLPIP